MIQQILRPSVALAVLALNLSVVQPTGAASGAEQKAASIPPDQIGAVAGKQYSGDGLSVVATNGGALLRCIFQRMNAHATAEGLWITSTVDDSKSEPFRVKAVAVGREGNTERGQPCPRELEPGNSRTRRSALQSLPTKGTVDLADKLVRFVRPGLTEEYSVSMDGVRQDFVIQERPAGDGKLRVELAVDGAKAEPLVEGARLVLEGSTRRIVYNRLKAVDSHGKELTATMQTLAENRLTVVLDDAGAVYPVRIDPTFSDSNWSSMGGIRGANGIVAAVAVGSSGNLYIGGGFTVVGDVGANGIAKWNGSSWSALGSGINSGVSALAVSGSDVYAGGNFTTAGGVAANSIAKWNGSSWSALGAGLNNTVVALAVSGSNVYAGGSFRTAGGSAANRIAKWDGSSWSALGSGMNNVVYALAVSGSDVYAGGWFTTAGGSSANRIAKWNGSSWSALGSGMNSGVSALAVSGSDVYAGGYFTTAGGKASGYAARAILFGEPQIISQPASQTVVTGGTVDFWVSAAGPGPLSYQWRFNGTNLANGEVSGVTTENLTITNVQTTAEGNYTVVITNTYGSVTSSVAALFTTPFNWEATRVARSSFYALYPFGMDVDATGNTYITAWFDGTNDFGGVTLATAPPGNVEIFVCKQNPAGQALWVKMAGGGVGSTTVWEGGRGVGTDQAGNVYVTGGFMGTATFGTSNVVGSAYGINSFLAKYDLNGNLVWLRPSGGALNSYGTGLAVDAAGNSFVVGRYFEYAYEGNLVLGTNILSVSSYNNDDVFVAKYNNAGDCLWARSINGPGNEYGNQIGIDTNGNVYVAGSFQATTTFSATNLTSAGNSDVFIAKYNNAGGLVWAKREGAVGNDQGLALAVDPVGGVYVGGAFSGTVAFGGTSLTNAGDMDAFFAKYDANGSLLWARRAGGTGRDKPLGAAVNTNGSCFFTGEFSSTASFGGKTITSSGGADVFIAKYSGAGVEQWVERAGGANDDSGCNIKIAPNGNCVVAGWFQGNAMFGNNSLVAMGTSDIFLARFADQVVFVPNPLIPPVIQVNDGNMRVVSNRFGFNFTGQSNQVVVVEVSTNLSNWLARQTNTMGNNSIYFSDSQWTNYPRRFYRLRSP